MSSIQGFEPTQFPTYPYTLSTTDAAVNTDTDTDTYLVFPPSNFGQECTIFYGANGFTHKVQAGSFRSDLPVFLIPLHGPATT